MAFTDVRMPDSPIVEMRAFPEGQLYALTQDRRVYQFDRHNAQWLRVSMMWTPDSGGY